MLCVEPKSYEMCTLCPKCMQHTSTLSPVKLRIMTISIKEKVLIKYGISEMMCTIKSQKAMKCLPLAVNILSTVLI